jgi:hypothetical protein
MSISIEAISFNHDPLAAARDALTIQKNATTAVTAPEWRRGTTRPEDSPAAYTIDQIVANRVTIKVQFRREAGDPASVQVSATGNAGNVLGQVKSRTITFTGTLSAFELFELDTAGQNPSVAVSNIAWNWFVDGTFRQTTEHRIYTILSAPQEPWGQPGSAVPDFQLPWTEVLDHACREAGGARNANEAAALLTRWVFSLGARNKLRYDDFGSGSSTFTIPGMRTFRCTHFLQALADTARWRVNCTDCATILSSFANILGCDLTQSQIGDDFQTNNIQKIGSGSPISQPFRFHEVAWKFPAVGAASVYDSCLQVDGDADPTDNDFSRPTLGINMPLDLGGRGGYYFRLVSGTRTIRVIGEQRDRRLRRKIDGQTTRAITLDPQQQCRLQKEYKFSDWKGTPKQDCYQHNGHAVNANGASKSEPQLFLKNYDSSKSPKSLAGFTPGKVESFKSEPDPFRVTEVVWSAEGCHGASLRVLTYECSSIPAARSFLLTLLGGFNLSGILRRLDFVVGCKQVKIGDVAFAGPDDLVLLFARANNVVLIQNVGQSFVPVSQFAHAMDTDMTSGPDPQPGKSKEMEHFQVYDKPIRVGDEVRLFTGKEPVTKEKETLFKVFAPAGEVFLKSDELLYRSKAPGEQCVTILAQRPGGETTRQVLELFAELPATNGCKCLESNKKEESVMPDVTGVWSSIRPTNPGGTNSSDMTVDGYMEITSRDPNTGEITGYYRDPGPTSPVLVMTGHVYFTSDGYYTIDLHHPVGGGVTRHYEGKLATFENSDFPVQIVAGNYHDTIDPSGPSSTSPSPSSIVGEDPCGAPLMMSTMALSGGQDNGTWVATKP